MTFPLYVIKEDWASIIILDLYKFKSMEYWLNFKEIQLEKDYEKYKSEIIGRKSLIEALYPL